METKNMSYSCVKCKCTKYNKKDIRVSSGFFEALFNIHSQRYNAIICDKCGFTEFYFEDQEKDFYKKKQDFLK